MAKRSGVGAGTVRNWRTCRAPAINLFDAVLNTMGYKLAIVPKSKTPKTIIGDKKYAPPVPSRPIDYTIIEDVSEETCILVSDILGTRRMPHIVDARHSVWFQHIEKHGFSQMDIERTFRVDHTTVVHAEKRRAKKLMEAEELK